MLRQKSGNPKSVSKGAALTCLPHPVVVGTAERRPRSIGRWADLIGHVTPPSETNLRQLAAWLRPHVALSRMGNAQFFYLPAASSFDPFLRPE